MKKPRKKPVNVFAFLRWLMEEERSLLDMQDYTGLTERQNRRLLLDMERGGWGVNTRYVGGFKYYSITLEPNKTPRPPSEKYVTMSEYATLAGVHKTSVRDRIKSGSVVANRRVGKNGRVSVLIDTVKYPPGQFRKQ